LAIVAPVPIDSSSGWACTSSSLCPPSGPLMVASLAAPRAGRVPVPGPGPARTGTSARPARLR
jgi:hypothetical protein